MDTNSIAQAADVTHVLRGRIETLLKQKRIKSGDGPPMAYFALLDGESVGRVVYQSFALGIQMEHGASAPWCVNPDTLLTATIENFEHWLDEGFGTLVWRHRPEVECEDGRWKSYMRCARLGTDSNSMKIMWDIC